MMSQFCYIYMVLSISQIVIWGFCYMVLLAAMFVIFISCVTLIVVPKSLFLWLMGLVAKGSEILRVLGLDDLIDFLTSLQLKAGIVVSVSYIQARLWSRVDCTNSRNEEKSEGRSLLDLPDLPLHCILDRLSPDGLCSMAAVCKSLRDHCESDYYWEKHLSEKWGRLLGQSAYKDWESARKRSISLSHEVKQMDKFISIIKVLTGYLGITDSSKSVVPCNESAPKDSTMALYLALDGGKLWFQAQVYNRMNGHTGFLLSCYDAKIRYEPSTNTFQARYSPHGRQTLEENIEWERIRAPSVETPSNTLHFSDCLTGLQPGDHIEIQWRRNKEFPYGWWYGVVGHLEICDGGKTHCSCYHSDTVVLEFKQYAQGSRWRKKMVNRVSHREEGDAVDGFYGGIRKLCKNEEISTWKCLWPSTTID